MVLLKITGLIIAFSVPSLLGFLKAFNVAKRSEKLGKIYVSVCDLCECIRTENTPKEKLLKKCFGGLINVNLTVNTEYLKNEDISFLNEFLISFGRKDKVSEYERARLYISRLEGIIENANKEKERLCKLYSSVGVLSGLALCIFLI